MTERSEFTSNTPRSHLSRADSCQRQAEAIPYGSGYGSGTKALIVYPMNALINSQVLALEDFARNYKKETGSAFPLTFAAYTGQTSDLQREEIIKSPPDILLTNYMMLELLMTRHGEEKLRESMFSSLEFLAFDELHTYRGRQGADVSYLIRRIRAACDHSLMTMGTSATMSSTGSHEEREEAVAIVASKIFGEEFPVTQVIGEKLARSLSWAGSLPSKEELARAVAAQVSPSADLAKLKSYPTAIWLENRVALEDTPHGLERRSPLTLGEASIELAEDSGATPPAALSHLTAVLTWIAEVNRKQVAAKQRYTCLPFKLHQFFAQTGSVYASLGAPDSRTVTLEPGVYEPGPGANFIFPHVFSRASGWSFNRQDAALQAGHFNDFIRVVRIRFAIYHALKSNGAPLTSKDLGRKVRETLNLDLRVYSDNEKPFPAQRVVIDNALETYLTYQAIYDLRRGWRVVLPNLEKCALLGVDYALRHENAAYEHGWTDVPIFNQVSKEMDHLLFDSAVDALELAAEYRRGSRVIPRKFPSFLEARIHDPDLGSFPTYKMAIITAANPGGKVQSDLENEKASLKLHDRLKNMGVLLKQFPVGSADGSHLEQSFLVGLSMQQAISLAKEYGQAAIFMIFRGERVELVGCNGEGRLELGSLSDLIAKPRPHSDGPADATPSTE